MKIHFISKLVGARRAVHGSRELHYFAGAIHELPLQEKSVFMGVDIHPLASNKAYQGDAQFFRQPH